MAAPSDISDILKSFPIQTLTRLAEPNSDPNHNTIRKVTQELYGNAAAIPSTEGGGRHGHLALLMEEATYRALGGAAAPLPAFPAPAVPAIPAFAGTTAAERAALQAAYDNNVKNYRTYYATERALKLQLIEATPFIYIETLFDATLGFTNVTALQLLTHLRTTYGAISPDDLTRWAALTRLALHPRQTPSNAPEHRGPHTEPSHLPT
jgi:hypothetical protein